VHDGHTATVDVPACNIVVLLAGRERHQLPVAVSFLKALVATVKQLPGEDPPRLKIRQAELNDPDELGRVLKAAGQLAQRQQLGHPVSPPASDR